MGEVIRVLVDGQMVNVPEGANVAAAVAQVTCRFRRSSSGAPRAPLCGMGVCFECRVTVDGDAQVLACLTLAREGMRVTTND